MDTSPPNNASACCNNLAEIPHSKGAAASQDKAGNGWGRYSFPDSRQPYLLACGQQTAITDSTICCAFHPSQTVTCAFCIVPGGHAATAVSRTSSGGTVRQLSRGDILSASSEDLKHHVAREKAAARPPSWNSTIRAADTSGEFVRMHPSTLD